MTFGRVSSMWSSISLIAFLVLLPEAFGNDLVNKYQPRYRISPIDGSKIALPTREQLDFQDRDIGVLIHFNIATYISIDGCNNVPGLVPNQSICMSNPSLWLELLKEESVAIRSWTKLCIHSRPYVIKHRSMDGHCQRTWSEVRYSKISSRLTPFKH